MCTSTATPPVWLSRKYPEILLKNEDGTVLDHGARQHASFSSPLYRKLSYRMIEQLAKHYGNDPRIIGWQLDNEPAVQFDYNAAAQQGFRDFLRKKYTGNIRLLNGNELKESDIKFEGDAGAKVSFSAVINNHESSELLTRATETAWEVGDSVGITCGDNQTNVNYLYKGEGSFEAKEGTLREIWVLGSAEYDVVAYAPFRGNSGEELSPVEVSTASPFQATAKDRAQIDYLYATGKATSQNPNVKLAFNHVMSRIKIQFRQAVETERHYLLPDWCEESGYL